MRTQGKPPYLQKRSSFVSSEHTRDSDHCLSTDSLTERAFVAPCFADSPPGGETIAVAQVLTSCILYFQPARTYERLKDQFSANYRKRTLHKSSLTIG